MHYKQPLIISLFFFSSHLCATYPYVDPQVGENLWQICSRTGDAVDYIIDNSSTSTVIDAIYQLAQETYTIVDGCCPCTVFLDQTKLPITITTKGYYCLTEDVTVNGNAITIAAGSTDDITIDLQGHILNSTTGHGIVTNTANTVIIKNGIIMALNGIGVNLGATGITKNANIIDIIAVGCQTGFLSGNLAYNVRYTNCEARTCTINGFDSNFPATSKEYRSCKANGNGGHGFRLAGAGNGLFVEDCLSSSNGGAGFFVTCGGFVFLTSTAQYNSSSGFSIIALNGTLKECNANGNGSQCNDANGDGFYVEPTTSGIIVVSCTSSNNLYRGFFSTSGANRFFNNFGIRNSTGGGNFFVGGGALVLSYTALASNNNISWWANIDGGFEWNGVCP